MLINYNLNVCLRTVIKLSEFIENNKANIYKSGVYKLTCGSCPKIWCVLFCMEPSRYFELFKRFAKLFLHDIFFDSLF